MTFAAWLHTFSPWVVRFTESWGIRWYGLAYLAGFVVAYFLLRWLAGRGAILIPRERIVDAMTWLVAGVVVGGRLGYVLVYDQVALITFTRAFPWWELLAIHHGGMASHGGMVGVVLAAWRVSRGWKNDRGEIVGRCPVLHVLDAGALVAPPGLFFGRIANFINGELLGRIVSPPGTPGPWWSVQFPQELKDWTEFGTPAGHAPDLSPQQQSELFSLVAEVARPNDTFRGAVERLVERSAEFADRLRPILTSRAPSQLLQAAAEGVVLGIVLWIIWMKPRKPGAVGAWFLIVYGVLRIATELVRLPDAGLAHQRILGLSRGQWLSVAMAIAGAILLRYAVSRPVHRLGGWSGRKPAAGAE